MTTATVTTPRQNGDSVGGTWSAPQGYLLMRQIQLQTEMTDRSATIHLREASLANPDGLIKDGTVTRNVHKDLWQLYVQGADGIWGKYPAERGPKPYGFPGIQIEKRGDAWTQAAVDGFAQTQYSRLTQDLYEFDVRSVLGVNEFRVVPLVDFILGDKIGLTGYCPTMDDAGVVSDTDLDVVLRCQQLTLNGEGEYPVDWSGKFFNTFKPITLSMDDAPPWDLPLTAPDAPLAYNPTATPPVSGAGGLGAGSPPVVRARWWTGLGIPTAGRVWRPPSCR